MKSNKRGRMLKTLAVGFALGVSFSPVRASAACGDLDTGFNAGSGANGPVYASVRQSDGKIILGGAFTSYAGAYRNYLARANTDGSNDSSYGASVNGNIYGMALDGNERLIVVGSFTYPASAIARFNANGTYDSTFTPASFDVYPTAVDIALDPDNAGKIYAAGYHSYVGGIYYKPRIVRLNVDGTIDNSFYAGPIDGGVSAVKALANGQLFIGGSFTTVSNIGRGRLAKLNSSGVLNGEFSYGSFADGAVLSIDVGSRLIIGGEFTHVNGVSCPYVCMLGIGNGEFASVPPAPNGIVRVVRAGANGNVSIGGDFTTVTQGGTSLSSGRFATYSYSSDNPPVCTVGSGFTAYASGTSVRTITIVPGISERAFCGGEFTIYNNNSRTRVAQIYNGN